MAESKIISKADYIVETGTYNGWTYRKWNSGISECWGFFSFTSTTYPANSGIVKNPPNMPEGLFIDKDLMTVNATARINQLGTSGTGFTAVNNTTQIQIWILNHSGAAATQLAYVSVHIYGTWK